MKIGDRVRIINASGDKATYNGRIGKIEKFHTVKMLNEPDMKLCEVKFEDTDEIVPFHLGSLEKV